MSKDFLIDIHFENEDYVITNGEMTEYLKLPDGRVLEAQYWIETNPPQPAGLKIVEKPEDIDKQFICDLNFAPKNLVFTYEGKEYGVNNRIFMVQYIALPDNTVLEYNFPDSAFEKDEIKTQEDLLKHIILKEVKVSITEQLEQGNLVKSEEKKPTSKMKP